MQRLARPLSDLESHYDAVVVGSGYGGGVAASRLARMGLRVAVLERGKEYLPGDFPDTMAEANEEFQVTSSAGKVGSRTGLYDLHMGEDMHVFVGCGLGGTSLINANVSLPPDPRVWEDPVWPTGILRNDDLEEGFRRAERMLRPTPYPNTFRLDKLRTMDRAAKALGAELERPPINVTFADGANAANVVQPACTLCGDCCSGCNVGAKTTVHMTYLPDAVDNGAQIFVETAVSTLRKEGDRWRVFFEPLGIEAAAFERTEHSLSADIVVLAAGSLGSTELLLRARADGLAVSDQLGSRFTGNGDVLAFAYNNDHAVNGIGIGTHPKPTWTPPGPCIAGLIDKRDTPRLADGYVIEEGVMPSALASLLPGLFASSAALFGKDTDIGDDAEEAFRRLQSSLLGAYQGAMHNTQTYLVMSHDDAAGSMTLRNDQIAVSWPDVARQPIFERVEAALLAATKANGGTYVRNPMQTTQLGESLLTVHPLGGCSMAEDRTRGVVNDGCQVFDGAASADPGAVHAGLYVCDGAVMPRALGVNPLLTITAVAERAMLQLARDRGLKFGDHVRHRAPRRLAAPEAGASITPTGVKFTERMSGHISKASIDDYTAAATAGRQAGNALQFTLTILIDDIERFNSEPDHTGAIVGTIDCPMLSREPLDVSDGVFKMMRRDDDAVEARRFDYTMRLSSRDGANYLLAGYKTVRDEAHADLWSDTSTLYVDVYEEGTASDVPVARGVLTINPIDFARQMRTLKGVGGAGPTDRMRAVAKFGALFAGSLYDVYGGPVAPLRRQDAHSMRKRRDLRVSVPEIVPVKTADGKTLRLTRYQGGSKGPLIFLHGLGVSSRIFSIDTIETNLLEYMFAAGYDCWLYDFRASTDLPYAGERWSADDVAIYDFAPAVEVVSSITNRPNVQVLAHCFGATTFTMSALAGLEGVRSAVLSQISTDVVVPWYPQRLLAHLRTPSLMSLCGVNAVDARAQSKDGPAARLMDWLIRLALPVQREERTHNATSNRITALYGQLYETDQLNAATFEHGLVEMFGQANIDAFRQLAHMARKSKVVDTRGRDVYLQGIEHLSQIPIAFIHGSENACFLPESTRRTFDRLTAINDPSKFSRHVIDGYGHIDCIFGKNAARDVYPLMLQHLEKTANA